MPLLQEFKSVDIQRRWMNEWMNETRTHARTQAGLADSPTAVGSFAIYLPSLMTIEQSCRLTRTGQANQTSSWIFYLCRERILMINVPLLSFIFQVQCIFLKQKKTGHTADLCTWPETSLQKEVGFTEDRYLDIYLFDGSRACLLSLQRQVKRTILCHLFCIGRSEEMQILWAMFSWS